MAKIMRGASIRCAFVGASLVVAQIGAPWPSLGFNAQRTSFTAYYGPDSNSVQHDTAFHGTNPIVHAPLIDADSWTYVGTENGTLYALSNNTIVSGWQATFSSGIGYMALADGAIFVPSTGLYALESDTGTQLWGYRLTTNFTSAVQQYSTPLQTSTIFATTGDSVHAVNATSGEALWSTIVPGIASPVAVADGGTVYVTWRPLNSSMPHGISALNAVDGTPLWTAYGQLGCNESIPAPAIDSGDTVYAIFPCDVSLIAFAPVTGAVTWNISVNGSSTDSSLAITDKDELFVAGNTSMLCFTVGNNGYVWQSGPAKAKFTASADGNLYVTARNNTVYALSSATGTTMWSTTLPSKSSCSEPIVGGAGQIVVACMNGQMYSITSAEVPPVWPQRGHDAGRSGLSSSVGPQGPDVVAVHTLTTNGAVLSSPVISPDGAAFIGSTDGNLYKLNGTKQSLCYTTGGPIWTSPAIGTNGFVYVGSDDTNFYAINGFDCTRVWNVSLGSKVRTAPMVGVIVNTVYVVVNLTDVIGTVFALNANTGATIWADNFAYRGADILVYGSGILVLPTVGGGGLNFLDPVTGKVTGTVPLQGAYPVTAATLNGNLFVSDITYGFVQWDIPSGNHVASYPTGMFRRLAIGGAGGMVYGTLGPQVIGFDIEAWNVSWSFTTNGTILSTPAVDASGTVYVGSNDSNVYALDGATGDLLWIFETQDSVESSPAIGTNGTLYIGSNDGNMYVLQDAPK